MRTFKLFKQSFGTENYLLALPYRQRQMFTKFRLSSHRLEIELGRHHKPKPIPAHLRICKDCDTGNIGDEKHALLHCPKYTPMRQSVFHKLSEFTDVNTMNDSDKFKFIMSYGNGDTEILHCIKPLIEQIMNRGVLDLK